MATELAKAYVQIVPSAQGISGSISSILSPEATSAGAEAGQKAGNSLVGELKGIIAAAGIGVLLKEALSSAYELGTATETAFAKLETIAGSDAIDGLTEDLKELSNQSGISCADLADVAYNAISAGSSAEEAMAMVESATKLATAGFTDSSSALSVLSTAMNSYGDSAGTVEEISDSLIMVQNLGVTTIDELASSMGRAIATSSAYSVDLGNLESAYVSVTKAGISTDQATTYISAMMDELGDSSSTVATILQEQTGKSFTELMEDGYSLGDALGILYDYCDDDSTAMMNLWSSANAGKASNAIVNQGLEEFNKNLKAITGNAGATEEAYETMSDTLEHQTEVMKTSFSNLGLSIYDWMEGPLSESVSFITNSVVPSLQSMMDGTMTFGDAFRSVMDGAGKLIGSFSNSIMEAIPGLVSGGMDAIGAIIEGIGQAIPEIVTWGVQVIAQLIEGIIDGLPDLIDSAVTAINAFIGGLVDMLPEVLDAAVDLFMALVDAIPIVIDSLLGALPDIITEVVDFLVGALPQIVEAGVTMLNGLVDAIPTIVESLVQNLPQIITSIVTGLVEAVPQILEAAITLFMALIDAIPTIVVELVEALPQIITSIVTGLTDAIPEIFQAAKDLLWQVIEAIPDIVTGLATAVPDIISGIVNGLLDGVDAVFKAAKNLGQGILNGIKGFFGINSPSTLMEEQGEYIVAGLENGIDDGDQGVVNAALSIGSNVMAGIESGASSVSNDVLKAFDNIEDEIIACFADIGDQFVKVGEQFIKVRTGLSNKWADVSDYLSSIRSNMLSKFDNIATNFETIGKNICTGIRTGLANGWPALESYVSQKANSLLTSAKKSLGISSPSKRFRDEFGAMIGAGAAIGLEDSIDEVDAAMADLIEATEPPENIDNTLMDTLRIDTAESAAYEPAEVQAAEVSAEFEQIIEILEQYFPEFARLADMQVVMDTGALVGEITTPMDKSLGKLNARKARQS